MALLSAFDSVQHRVLRRVLGAFIEIVPQFSALHSHDRFEERVPRCGALGTPSADRACERTHADRTTGTVAGIPV